jgi:hypothetical protein
MLQGKLRLTTVDGQGRHFVAETASDHALVMDDAEGHTGPQPIEMA